MPNSLKEHILSLCPDWQIDERMTEMAAKCMSLDFGGMPPELSEYLATCIPRTDAIADCWTVLSADSICDDGGWELVQELRSMGYFSIADCSGNVYTVGKEDGRVYYCDVGFDAARTEESLNEFSRNAQRHHLTAATYNKPCGKIYESLHDFFSNLLTDEEVLFD